MLKKTRQTLAVISLLMVTLLFLDFTGTAHAWLGWIAKIQFLPAVMALNAGVILALVLLTLLLGRVYCSVICPLGIMQDVFAHFGKRSKRNRYSYSPAKNVLRYTMLALMIIAIIAGINAFVVLLAPYSAYGRIVQSLLAPVWQWGNNLLAALAERAGSYTFYSVDVWLKGGITLAVAIVTLIALAILSWRNGRTYCNTICPVGTVLGLLSRFSLLRPVIDTSKCNGWVSAHATARRRASTARLIRSTTRAAWHVWTVSTSATMAPSHTRDAGNRPPRLTRPTAPAPTARAASLSPRQRR